MNERTPPKAIDMAPRRLLHDDDAVGALLRHGAASRLPMTAPPFAELEAERRRRSRRNQITWAAPLLVAAGALFAVLSSEPSPQDSIAAEPEALVGRSPLPTQAKERQPESTLEKEQTPTPESFPNPKTKTRAPVRASSPPPTPSTDCQALTNAGSFEEAVGCYDLRTNLGGMSAELAFLEKARLQQKVLASPAAALETLTSYATRFPNGALYREATLKRIQAHIRIGQKQEALLVLSQALERIPERTAELAGLAARLHLESKECVKGEQRLRQAEKAGAQVSALLPLLADCR